LRSLALTGVVVGGAGAARFLGGAVGRGRSVKGGRGAENASVDAVRGVVMANGADLGHATAPVSVDRSASTPQNGAEGVVGRSV
jgi:hypothetical protein